MNTIVAKLSWENRKMRKWERRSIMTELWDLTNEIPYVPNNKEDTASPFQNKCRTLRTSKRDQQMDTADLSRLIRT